MFCNKRKRDQDHESKKPKAPVGDKEKELISQSSEWPMYMHPEGGTVKITPWGSLRQWVNPETGQACTKFEDASFQELSFGQNQSYDLPSTPMSMNPSSSARSSPAPGEYMGTPATHYGGQPLHGHSGNGGYQEFAQEQENYLGMDDNDEYSDDTTMA